MVMLVVLAVIFYLAMSNFKSVSPSALEIQKHNKARKSGQDVRPEDLERSRSSTSASADSWTPSPPSKPSLSTMDQKTAEHTSETKDALSQAN